MHGISGMAVMTLPAVASVRWQWHQSDLTKSHPRASMQSRTKTTGAGKKAEELNLHIDREAWLAHPSWLEVGPALWQHTGTARDNFLVLPSANHEHVNQNEAQYSDCQGKSRALLERLVDD